MKLFKSIAANIFTSIIILAGPAFADEYGGDGGIGWCGWFLIIVGVVIVGVVIWAIVSSAQERKKREIKKTDLVIAGIEWPYSAGKYITGHPKLNEPTEKMDIGFSGTEAILYWNNGEYEIGRIPLAAIEEIKVLDASTMEQRVTATRLVAMGVFAFAFKKKEKRELAYVIVKWQEGKFPWETIFEFSGPESMSVANSLRSEFVRRANAV